MRYRRDWTYCTALLLLHCFLNGCATPAEKFSRTASDFGFTLVHSQGLAYKHVIYSKGIAANGSKTLSVYLGSDGSPWIGSQPATDPTPRNPLALRLMSFADGPSIYVGRPCYHGLSLDSMCNSAIWTSARYSAEVIGSMAKVIENYVRVNEFQRITLIGYSGGGTIAVLLAQKLTGVSAVITVAANLDTDAWIRHHDFEPLTGSLNPTLEPPLDKAIYQLHLMGGVDQTVPPRTADLFFERHKSATLKIYPDFDHRCCWDSAWHSVLANIEMTMLRAN